MAIYCAAKQRILSSKAVNLLPIFLFMFPVSVHTIRSTDRAARSWIAEISDSGAAVSSSLSSQSTDASSALPVLEGYSTYVIISCPSLAKIVYTQVSNGVSVAGRTDTLIDGGLISPTGIAIDKTNQALYIADKGARTIYRYGLVATDQRLGTDGNRITIWENSTVESVAVDDKGNLFFTAQGGQNSINKIPVTVISNLVSGMIGVSSIATVSENQMVADALAKASESETGTTDDLLPTDAPEEPPAAYSLYEAASTPQLTVPGAVLVDGANLLWTNTVDGTQAGTVVQGQTDPQVPLPSHSAFPATVLFQHSDTAYGLAKTETIYFWTTDDGFANTGAIWGQQLADPSPLQFAGGLGYPKGIAWDGDGTMYYADPELGWVQSFPSGRMMNDAPLTHTVDIVGAYGVAVFKSDDAGY